jgi:hypothetical protein
MNSASPPVGRGVRFEQLGFFGAGDVNVLDETAASQFKI